MMKFVFGFGGLLAQKIRTLVECFQDELAKNGVGPCKPHPRKFLRVILVESLVHEAGAGVRALQVPKNANCTSIA
jgi:hypothetical protein